MKWATPTRSWLALAAIAVGLAWFKLGAPPVARAMMDARARSLPSIQPFHLLAAVGDPGSGATRAASQAASLPTGEDAARAADLLEALLVQEAQRVRWARQALAALDDDQVAKAKANASPTPLPRSRAHRYLPPEMLLMEETLAARFGSVPATAALPADETRWADGTPVDIQWGLLAVITSNEPALTEAQARLFQAALLDGMVAHEVLPDIQAELEAALGPELTARALQLSREGGPNLQPDRLLAQAPDVIAALRAR